MRFHSPSTVGSLSVRWKTFLVADLHRSVKLRQRPNGHCRAPPGVIVGKQALARLAQAPPSPELPAAIRQLRMKRSRPMRLTGEPEKKLRKAASSSVSRKSSRGSVRSSRALQLHLAAQRRQTCSTGRRPDNRRSHRCGCRSRCGIRRSISALVLDGQIGNAAPRIDLVGCGKGIGRAGVQTGPAGAAMVALRRVRAADRRW